MSSKNLINPRLPVGFRFRPTEVELLKFLKSKVLGESLPCDNVIKDNVDVYNIQDLQNVLESLNEGDVVYVFTKLKRVSKVGGKRFERQVGDLTWKGSDKGKNIEDEGIRGNSKNFSLRKWGILLGYNMKEYCLDESTLKNAKENLKDYVLCSIKRNKSEENGNFRIENSAEKLLSEGSKSLVKDKYGGIFATSSENVSIPRTSGTKEINSARLDQKVEPFSQECQYRQSISPTEVYFQNQYQAHQHDDTNATRSGNASIPCTSAAGVAYVELATEMLKPCYQAYQQNQYHEKSSLTDFYPQNQYDRYLNTVINPHLPLHSKENNASTYWLPFPKPYYERNPYQESQRPFSNEGLVDPEEADWILGELASEITISHPEKNLLNPAGPTSQFNDPLNVPDQSVQIDSSEAMLTRMVPLAMILPTTDSRPTVKTEVEVVGKTTGIAESKTTPPAADCQGHKTPLVHTSNKKRKSSNLQPHSDSEDAECSNFGRKLAKTLLEFATAEEVSPDGPDSVLITPWYGSNMGNANARENSS